MASLWQRIRKPPWRTIVPATLLLMGACLAYWIWSPGERVTDGRHDHGANGMWAAHGWMGGDDWFRRNQREPDRYRSAAALTNLRALLDEQHVRYLFPHLCPSSRLGELPSTSPEQVERLLDAMDGIEVIPWIGGVNEQHCLPESAPWRERFVKSACELLQQHPRLAGVQINIEPMPTGTRGLLELLDQFREQLPSGKILSVAAYPPPTRWHSYPEVHWDEGYFRGVARRCDLVCVMMYDTGLRLAKPYERLMADWTGEVLDWAGETPVLLGIPAYDDADSGYHHPGVENVEHAIRGVHAGLQRLGRIPENYRGIAVYSEWELQAEEREYMREEFLSGAGAGRPHR